MTRAMVAAHRGVASGAAENTIEAFTKAIHVGADMIEFDVRRTRDGELIVTSFLPAVIAQAKDAFPEVETGLLVDDGGPWSSLPARLYEFHPIAVARRVGADYLAPHYGLAALGIVRRAATAGLPCLLWTVNSPALIRRYAADPRIAAIITDVAAQAVSIVTGAATRA